MGILPRQKQVEQNQRAQEYKKGDLQRRGFRSQVFYDLQYIHGKPLLKEREA
jgi:hypothetical protein